MDFEVTLIRLDSELVKTSTTKTSSKSPLFGDLGEEGGGWFLGLNVLVNSERDLD